MKEINREKFFSDFKKQVKPVIIGGLIFLGLSLLIKNFAPEFLIQREMSIVLFFSVWFGWMYIKRKQNWSFLWGLILAVITTFIFIVFVLY